VRKRCQARCFLPAFLAAVHLRFITNANRFRPSALRSPRCVPLQRQRKTTLSPSASRSFDGAVHIEEGSRVDGEGAPARP
jgi:hypothetical protein